MVLHFLIQGRVQGVGFRWYVQREAGELDLRGWVRNTEEGEVEVVASGSAEDLAELRASLRRGPRGSRVDRLVEHYLEDREAEGLNSFRIAAHRVAGLGCTEQAAFLAFRTTASETPDTSPNHLNNAQSHLETPENPVLKQ